jgi:hypothetical protein
MEPPPTIGGLMNCIGVFPPKPPPQDSQYGTPCFRAHFPPGSSVRLISTRTRNHGLKHKPCSVHLTEQPDPVSTTTRPNPAIIRRTFDTENLESEFADESQPYPHLACRFGSLRLNASITATALGDRAVEKHEPILTKKFTEEPIGNLSLRNFGQTTIQKRQGTDPHFVRMSKKKNATICPWVGSSPEFAELYKDCS